MKKTFDGRRIGGIYRHVPSDIREGLKLPVVVFVLTIVAISSLTVGVAADRINPYMSLVIAAGLIVWTSLQALHAYDVLAKDPKFFKKYVILRDSVSDFGQSVTLVRWVHDGSHDWIQSARKSKMVNLKFITD